ncbi:hypothetical protein FBY06_10631 [Pseudomonas sp. SJZ085]|nr:hypothetical protein FBX99_106169 [Pseudomonas sp. SJZ074]TWC39280.1 hypothetical protein FBY06_10631 [Pseudomonas sp. SJZ085]
MQIRTGIHPGCWVHKYWKSISLCLQTLKNLYSSDSSDELADTVDQLNGLRVQSVERRVTAKDRHPAPPPANLIG